MVIVTWQHKQSTGEKGSFRAVLKELPAVATACEKRTLDATGQVAWVSYQCNRVTEMLILALCRIGCAGIAPPEEAAARLGADLVIDLGTVA